MAHDPRADLRTLRSVLGEAQALGFLGPQDLDRQLDHSLALAAVLERALDDAPALGGAAAPGGGGPGSPGERAIADLGSGGGLPGLVIAACLGEARVTLVESQGRRARFLDAAVVRIAPGGRVRVVHDRAERVGRIPEHRRAYAAVTARSFARPAVTAECAAPLLAVGGVLVVSDPPGDAAGAGLRWPAEKLAPLGLQPLDRPGGPYRFQVLAQVEACPDRFPRRVGVPGKRPLF